MIEYLWRLVSQSVYTKFKIFDFHHKYQLCFVCFFYFILTQSDAAFKYPYWLNPDTQYFISAVTKELPSPFLSSPPLTLKTEKADM